MPDALTTSAPVSILLAECPVCAKSSQVTGGIFTCMNDSCEVFGKAYDVEAPKVDVVLRGGRNEFH